MACMRSDALTAAVQEWSAQIAEWPSRVSMSILTRSCNFCHGQGMVASDTCEVCHGSGTVTKDFSVKIEVPAGAPDGWSQVYKLNDGSKVRFRVHQVSSPSFERRDADLVTHVHISLKEVEAFELIEE